MVGHTLSLLSIFRALFTQNLVPLVHTVRKIGYSCWGTKILRTAGFAAFAESRTFEGGLTPKEGS